MYAENPAVIDAMFALSQHWYVGKYEQKLFDSAYFGSSAGSPETFLWVIVSDEQKQDLITRRPLRKALRELNNQLMQELEEPIKTLGGQRPNISLVRESRLDALFRWSQSKNLDLW